MGNVLSQKEIILGASQQRIWSLLGRVIIDSLELEKFKARDDRNFRAVMLVKMLFVTVPMQIKGEMVNITPPETMDVLLDVEGFGGTIKLKQTIQFRLTQMDNEKTKLVCSVLLNNIGSMIVFKPIMKIVANRILNNIEKLLIRFA